MKRLSFFLMIFVWILGIHITATAQTTNAPFRVYLAFEDGPTDAYTPEILDILAQYDAKASFLIAGARIAGNEDIIQREVREGHAIVNHLWVEEGVYAGSRDDAVIESYLRTESAIREAIGAELLPVYDAQTKMFWQPGGGIKPLPTIEGVHVITYNWHVDSDDCGYHMPDTVDLESYEFDQAVIDNVLGVPVNYTTYWNAFDYGDGVIIAFHDLNRVTARVLPTIISELRAAGATFHALPRTGDVVDTMPVVIGVPPDMNWAGIEGATMRAKIVDGANFRQSPEYGEIVQWLEPELAVTVTGRSGDWFEVRVGEVTGWVHEDRIQIFGPIPNLPRRG
ncbi:MAG: polysaccharide deacetylase family protein [Anaerolineae bacterium]|nr:polysaccharide deacetylase family protein [Anaerolineae bacterium]